MWLSGTPPLEPTIRRVQYCVLLSGVGYWVLRRGDDTALAKLAPSFELYLHRAQAAGFPPTSPWEAVDMRSKSF